MGRKLKPSRYNVVVPIPEREESIVFNTFTRGLLIVDGETASALQGTSDFLQNTTLELEELSELTDAGLLVPYHLNEASRFQNFMNRFKYHSDNMPLFVSFTSRCNLACPYCYEDVRAATSVTKDMDKETWDLIMEYLKKRIEIERPKNLILLCFGGEPLMNYDLMRYAIGTVLSLESQYLGVRISLVTNGTLLSESRLQELAPLLKSVQITVDGPPELHNQTRPYKNGKGTYNDIMRSIRNCLSYESLQTTLRINVSEDAVSDTRAFLQDVARTLPGADKLTVSPSPIFPDQTTLECSGPEALHHTGLGTVVADLYVEAALLGFRLNKPFLPGPCMAIINSAIVIDENQNAYRCPGRLYQEPDAHLGSDGILEILRTEWYRHVDYEPQCSLACEFGPICYGGCRWKAGTAESVACPKEWLEPIIGKLLLAYVHAEHERCL